MKPVVRGFIFNPEGDILFARHNPNTPWVLPWWHIENGEALHEAMIREIQEEFGIRARFFEIDEEEVVHHNGKSLVMHPLPIASYDLVYKNAKGIDQSRTEYIFLMETDDEIQKVQSSEIVEFAWFSPEKILSMKSNTETWDFYQEILEKIIWEDELWN